MNTTTGRLPTLLGLSLLFLLFVSSAPQHSDATALGPLGGSAASASSAKKYAYVTIHYEGTPNDDCYILGIRVLLQSLKPLQHPFIILASDSVTQRSRDIFTQDGATIVPVENVPNPFGHVLKRFLYTFNKLHLWNMTEYERIIYLDADNIAMNVNELNKLFFCGHFCVLFMNPCHFHTGLMVIKPNATLHAKMLSSLATTGSYDGADQGFLSAFFHECTDARLFDPDEGPSEEPVNQLHVGYNMHALYHMGTGDVNHFRCGAFSRISNKDRPSVATMGYPLAVILKPWYWYSPFLSHTRVWNEYRSELHEPWLAQELLGRVVALIAIWGFVLLVLPKYLRREQPTTAIHRIFVKLGPGMTASILGVVAVLTSMIIGFNFFPKTWPPSYGIPVFIAIEMASVLFFARVIGCFVFQIPATATDHIVPVQALLFPALTLGFVFSGDYTDWIFKLIVGPSLLHKIFSGLLSVASTLMLQINIFLHLSHASPLFAGK